MEPPSRQGWRPGACEPQQPGACCSPGRPSFPSTYSTAFHLTLHKLWFLNVICTVTFVILKTRIKKTLIFFKLFFIFLVNFTSCSTQTQEQVDHFTVASSKFQITYVQWFYLLSSSKFHFISTLLQTIPFIILRKAKNGNFSCSPHSGYCGKAWHFHHPANTGALLKCGQTKGRQQSTH